MDSALQSSSGPQGYKQVTNAERNEDLKPGRIRFRDKQDRKIKYQTYVKHIMYSKLLCNMKLQTSKKEQGV